jgi:hypothetical protein
MFRISKDLNTGTDVAQVDEIEPVIRASGTDRYRIDQIEREPLPSGHTSRRWGIGVKRDDGSAEIEPDPLPFTLQ